jgi:hypothetical protein
MAGYYETKTMTRAEFEEANRGTQAQLRVSYEQYLKNIGLNSEAEALARRAKEDAEGKVFGTQKDLPLGVTTLSTRADIKMSDEEYGKLQTAQAENDAFAAKQIIALSGGRITGQEPVYIYGTPEFKAYMKEQFDRQRATGKPAQEPNAYLDAQAFADRFIEYSRLGGTESTVTTWDDAKKQYVTQPSPWFNAKVLEPIPGMGNDWSALNNAKWATVQAGVGRTAATEQAEYDILNFFSKTVADANGNPNPAGQRFFMRTPGDITSTGVGTPTPAGTPKPAGTTPKTLVTANMDAATKAIIQSLEKQISDLGGTASTTASAAAAAAATAATYNERMSVYSSMADRFNKYGLSSLANKIKELAIKGATESTITLELMETDEAKQRFSANAERVKKGIAALSPADYVNAEDGYRQVLRAYGLKQFDNDAYVKQFLANGTSPTELSSRVSIAVQRVQNADPAIIKQLKDYYGIGATDMVAYVLDPEQQLPKIERQVSAAEIGVAAGRQGITAGVSVAEQLAAQGITEAQAQKGYSTIADYLPTAEKLSSIYGDTMDKFGQSEAEQIEFNSLASAQRKRDALRAREIAAFSGSSGTNKTSLTTSNVGQF